MMSSARKLWSGRSANSNNEDEDEDDVVVATGNVARRTSEVTADDADATAAVVAESVVAELRCTDALIAADAKGRQRRRSRRGGRRIGKWRWHVRRPRYR